ncbi:MAG: exosortase [Desulfarculus sp.]|nr:exosortase [Pseudomonadota bacterium]MBV1717171.1 exosortase [Desulfarculus sp.]MBU4576641.1 exosortase [Pseudomonadota bacterium]MBU4598397.1 exosortase [Pseudomonadota bacterium]MBV1739493.1 exosortase [Desulfarculus sp.]
MSQKRQESSSASPLLTWLAWAVVLGLLAWVYTPIVSGMVANWWVDPNYSHGFLVPLISAYLVWRQRKELAEEPKKTNYLGLVIVAASLALLVMGQLAHEFYLRRVSLIPLMWGLVLLAWGWHVARRVLFAFAYLILMVPLPYLLYDAVAFPLRLIAAEIASWGIRLFGIPVYLEGNVIHLPNLVMNIVDACSGIRSLISLLAVGVILAYLILPNRWVKVIVVILVPPVAVFTNALRVTLAGVLSQWVGPQTLEGVMHDFVGWAVFMAGFILLLFITLLLKKLSPTGKEVS